MEESKRVALQCLFCLSTQFVLPEDDYKPRPGELIQCGNCGRLNDYDSLVRVVQRKEREWLEEQAQLVIDDFTKQFEGMFK